MQAEERTEDEDEATPDTADEGADSVDEARSDSEEEAGDDDGDASDEGSPKSSGGDSSSDSGSGDAGDENAEGIAAPSIGPDTEIEREPPEERLARHEQSTTDAMGNDKRRAVTERSYGASKTKRLALYGGFLVVLAVIVFAVQLAISQFDKPRDRNGVDPAPWAQDEARQVQPTPLSFPRNGQQDIEQPDSDLGDAQNAAQGAGAQEPEDSGGSGSASGGSGASGASGS